MHLPYKSWKSWKSLISQQKAGKRLEMSVHLAENNWGAGRAGFPTKGRLRLKCLEIAVNTLRTPCEGLLADEPFITSV